MRGGLYRVLGIACRCGLIWSSNARFRWCRHCDTGDPTHHPDACAFCQAVKHTGNGQ